MEVKEFRARSARTLRACVNRAANHVPAGGICRITVDGCPLDTLLSVVNRVGGWTYVSTLEEGGDSSALVRRVDLTQTSPASPLRIHTLGRKTILIDHGRHGR